MKYLFALSNFLVFRLHFLKTFEIRKVLDYVGKTIIGGSEWAFSQIEEKFPYSQYLSSTVVSTRNEHIYANLCPYFFGLVCANLCPYFFGLVCTDPVCLKACSLLTYETGV